MRVAEQRGGRWGRERRGQQGVSGTTDWLHMQADGLAWDEKGKRFLRFGVEREWLLVKA